jgi:hypothetical protein
MRLPAFLTILILVAAPAASGVGAPFHAICAPQPTICTTFLLGPDDRFDPFVQHLLVRGQLEALPTHWVPFYFLLPPVEDPHLLELQIRYLDELLRRRSVDSKP